MQNYCWHLGYGLGLQSWDSYAIVDVKDVSTKVGVILYRQDFGFSPRRWVSWVLGKIPGQHQHHDESREGGNYQLLWERSRVVLDVRNSLGQWHLLLGKNTGGTFLECVLKKHVSKGNKTQLAIPLYWLTYRNPYNGLLSL